MAKNKSKHKELWKNSPDEHDFPAAKDYLSLITGQKIAEVVVDSLKVPMTVAVTTERCNT